MDRYNDYGVPYTAPHGSQRVLNESWPLVDENGKRHARGIPTRPGIEVRVRVAFETDGEVWLDGVATRWHGRSVFIVVEDPRLLVKHVWVDGEDVKRRFLGPP